MRCSIQMPMLMTALSRQKEGLKSHWPERGDNCLFRRFGKDGNNLVAMTISIKKCSLLVTLVIRAGSRSQFDKSPLKVAARGTGRMSIAPTVSTIQRFLINTKLTILLLISLLRMLSTMLMLVTTVMKRMIKMTEHCRACKRNPRARPNFTKMLK